MLISIDYTTRYSYDAPSAGILQALRVKPRGTDGQSIRSWRIDVDAPGPLRETRDAYGNHLHVFSADAPLASLTLRVTGRVDTSDQSGVVSGTPEPLPVTVFLRSTALTSADGDLRDLAYAASRADRLTTLHELMRLLRGAMRFDTGSTNSATPAATAFGRRHGVCQDYAQIFIACARLLGIPARYVSGHFARIGMQEAAHAWAEAFVDGLGWVGFDPVNGICPDDRYVRVAVGLDYLDAAPVRGARRGGGTETMTVAVRAEGASQQQQQQQGQKQGQGQAQSQR